MPVLRRTKPSKTIPPQPGWAIYLRTSDEEAQNPEASQSRQRFLIHTAVTERSTMPIYAEYKDVITGRTPNRTEYLRMLHDARLGKFSHVVVERPDRFGRNDTEALRAIDELHEFGVAVRFANHPELDPIDPDDRVIVTLSFTLARRESMILGLRIRGAAQAKRQAGGFVGRVPDGYISIEDDEPHRKTYAKKGHHMEIDPERAKMWRLAWDLLLKDSSTLAEICEELHRRGYRYRSGRPFIEITEAGKRKANYNSLARAFHNWTYAGWIVSEEHGIAPKTLRGNWEPIVTTEELERGIALLQARIAHKQSTQRHDYLLKGMLFLVADPKDPTLNGEKLHRLTGSNSNSSRPGGGTKHYRLERYPIHFMCAQIDDQLEQWIEEITIDEEMLPRIRSHYINEVGSKLGRLRPDERSEVERALRQIDEEEARSLRLFAAGMVSDETWRALWNEWQDRRTKLRASLELLEKQCDVYVRDLDDALSIISRLGVLYHLLSRSEKRDLLRNLVLRVVVNPEGLIVRLELLPPFSYLREVCSEVSRSENGEGSSVNQTGDHEIACSSSVPYSDPNETRTHTTITARNRRMVIIDFGSQDPWTQGQPGSTHQKASCRRRKPIEPRPRIWHLATESTSNCEGWGILAAYRFEQSGVFIACAQLFKMQAHNRLS